MAISRSRAAIVSPGLDEHRVDHAVPLGPQLRLHFHRFDRKQRVARAYRLTWFDRHCHDHAGIGAATCAGLAGSAWARVAARFVPARSTQIVRGCTLSSKNTLTTPSSLQAPGLNCNVVVASRFRAIQLTSVGRGKAYG
jgi:hypothetical protein